MTNHTLCTHPATKAGRAKCRRENIAPATAALAEAKKFWTMGYRHSIQTHRNPAMDYLDYWDSKYTGHEFYNDFLDGWTFAASDDPEYDFGPTNPRYREVI